MAQILRFYTMNLYYENHGRMCTSGIVTNRGGLVPDSNNTPSHGCLY